MKTSVPSTIALTILSDEAPDIEQAITAQLNHQAEKFADVSIDVVQCAMSATNIDVNNVSVLLADPDLAASIIEKCPSLTWCQSTWAGNAPLLQLNKKEIGRAHV